jgi:mannose-6-phosphate isomerase-like protein (cupin superfamily)
MNTDKSTAKFPKPSEVGPREWGHEVLLVHAPKKYTLKKIMMHKGAKGGLQFHRCKDEAGVMLYGQMDVRYDDGTGAIVSRVVVPGDVFHFPTGSVHQAEAMTDCAYYEVSTPHFNDRVHVEHEYGIEEEAGGLPSTELYEVEMR